MIIKRGTATVIENDYDDGFDLITGRTFTVEVLYLNGNAGKFAFAWESYSGQLVNGAYEAPMVLDVDVETDAGATALFTTFCTYGMSSYTWVTPLVDVSDEEASIDFPITITQGGTGATTVADALANLGAAAVDHTHDGYAASDHTHSNYAFTTDVTALQDALTSKANYDHTHDEYAAVSHVHDDYASVNHTHSEYASFSHSHNDYATVSALDELETIVEGKADSSHSHSEYTTVNALDALSEEVSGKADANHSHTEYAASSHTHSQYATTAALSELEAEVGGKAASSHAHDDKYYTESEMDAMLNDKANASHTHSDYALVNHAHSNYSTTDHTHADYAAASHSHSNYVTVLDFETLEDEVAGKASSDHVHSDYAVVGHNHDDIYYTESEVDSMLSSKANSSHNHDSAYDSSGSAANALASANAYTDAEIANLLNNSTTVVDSIMELAAAMEDNADAIEALESVAASKASAVHTHEIADVTDLQSTLDEKANADHNHNNVYYTESEVDSKLSANLASANVYTDGQIDSIKDGSITVASATTATTASSATKATKDASGNVITSTYETKSDASAKLAEAKGYTDSAIGALGNTYYTETEIDTKIDVINAAISGKAATSHNHDSAYDAKGASASALVSANAYTDEQIELLDYAPSSHSHAIADVAGLQSEFDSLESSLAGKASASHSHSAATQTAAGFMSAADKAKLDGIAANANNYTYTLPSAGTSLGGVKSGGDVTISGGLITVNDDSHNHIIANVDGLQDALDGKAASSHSHDDVYYTESEIDEIVSGINTSISGKAASSHTHTIANVTNLQSSLDAKVPTSRTINGKALTANITLSASDVSADASGTAATQAAAALQSAKDYADDIKDDLLNGAGTAYDTLKELGDLIDVNTDAIDALETVAASKANAADLTSHVNNKSNPHAVTLAQLGVTATAAELNKLDGVTATTAELNYVDGVTSNIQTQLNAKAASGHTHSAATTSAAGLMSAADKSKLDGIASGANAYTLPTASSTLGGVKTTSTVTSASGYTACPIISGVPYYKDTNTTYSLSSFGVTATAAELNALDGITATVTELNYMDGVTSNVQTQLNAKAASSHTHNYAGSSSAGGAATSAVKLETARTISLTGDVTGSTSFDGTGNVSITATVADDSHNHTIANVDGLQTALDAKSASDHTHTAAALISMADALFGTASNGGVEYSYGSGNTVNVLDEIASMPVGLHTIYSITGTEGNPKTTESWRMLVHKTNAAIGWVLAFDAQGSIYSNYQSAASTFKGWRCIYDVTPPILWMGEYWCTETQTVTPSKKLSECRNGWVLVWTDYDVDNEVSTNGDCYTTVIPKYNAAHTNWTGQNFIATIPSYLNDSGTLTWVGKRLYVYDAKITGNAVNHVTGARDVCLRAIYEY